MTTNHDTAGKPEAALLADVQHCLEEYYAYAESMRKIGRGFHPTGLTGYSIESVLAMIRSARTSQETAVSGHTKA